MSYTYDPETQTYARTSANTLTTDELTNEPIKLSNVLFFEMAHRIIDNEGRRDIRYNFWRKAYVFQAGHVREVKWENRDGLLNSSRRRW